MVSDPLTKYMFCSPAEGAVALVLCRGDLADRFTDAAGVAAVVRDALPASTARSRCSARRWRPSAPTDRPSHAARAAFELAGIGPGDVDVAQIQDTESGAELMHMAETGLCAHGEQDEADPRRRDRDRRTAADQHRRRLPGQRRADRRVRACARCTRTCCSCAARPASARCPATRRSAFTHVYGAPGHQRLHGAVEMTRQGEQPRRVEPWEQEVPPEVAPVRPGEELDWDRLEAYLRPLLEIADDAPAMTVLQFPNGSANLTYLLTFGATGGRFVLRRPPFGVIAPGAHDMKREFRVLSRLWQEYDRAPRAFVFCDDHDVVGADFVVCEYRRGEVDLGRRCRRRWPACPTPAGASGSATVDALADLHLVDPAACGLGDLGRPDGFVDRQLAGWRKRWELVATPTSTRRRWTAAGDELARRSAPASSRATFLHNDFKLDNCQFTPGRARSGDVGVRLGHGHARRPARRPRHAAELLARPVRHRRRPGPPRRPAWSASGCPPRGRCGRALRRAHRVRRRRRRTGTRRSPAGGRARSSASSCTSATCAARAPTSGWPAAATTSACSPTGPAGSSAGARGRTD